jgi:ankyrin repeat protein
MQYIAENGNGVSLHSFAMELQMALTAIRPRSETDDDLEFLLSCSAVHVSALHKAVRTGKCRVAKLLLDHNFKSDATYGFNIDVTDADGLTPLHCAVCQGNLDITTLLLDRGAKIDMTDAEGRTVLHRAIITDTRLDFVELILDRDNTLIETVDIDDYTPLLMAARHGRHCHVKILLDRGANIDATDGVGRTARRIAEVCGRKSVIEVLTRYTVERQTNVAPVIGVPDDVVEEIAVTDIITTVDITPNITGPKRRAEASVIAPTWATKKPRSSTAAKLYALPGLVARVKPS